MSHVSTTALWFGQCRRKSESCSLVSDIRVRYIMPSRKSVMVFYECAGYSILMFLWGRFFPHNHLLQLKPARTLVHSSFPNIGIIGHELPNQVSRNLVVSTIALNAQLLYYPLTYIYLVLLRTDKVRVCRLWRYESDFVLWNSIMSHIFSVYLSETLRIMVA